jgi:cytochrome c553
MLQPLRWRIGVLGLLAAAAQAAAAQDSTTPAPPPRTTLSGVYTAAQAERGRNTYLATCRSCHSPSEHTENGFKRWVGHPVSELFSYLVESMPQNDPGALDPKDYADVVAYFLLLNALPTGEVELPTEVTELEKIRVEKPPPPPPSPSTPTPSPPQRPTAGSGRLSHYWLSLWAALRS